MTIELKNIPGYDIVQPIIAAWRANAEEAGMLDDCLVIQTEDRSAQYLGPVVTKVFGPGPFDFDRDRTVVNEGITGLAWVLYCNYERGPIMTYFPELDLWLQSQPYGETTVKMEGGTDEAMSNAMNYYCDQGPDDQGPDDQGPNGSKVETVSSKVLDAMQAKLDAMTEERDALADIVGTVSASLQTVTAERDVAVAGRDALAVSLKEVAAERDSLQQHADALTANAIEQHTDLSEQLEKECQRSREYRDQVDFANRRLESVMINAQKVARAVDAIAKMANEGAYACNRLVLPEYKAKYMDVDEMTYR